MSVQLDDESDPAYQVLLRASAMTYAERMHDGRVVMATLDGEWDDLPELWRSAWVSETHFSW